MLNRCWLEIDAIVERLQKLRVEHADLHLERVFVSTNAEPEWIEELKKALRRTKWRFVLSTRDLVLTWEEGGVNAAIGPYCFPSWFVRISLVD